MIKKFINNWWTLVIILLVASSLRLWHLGSVPPSLTQDEASLGYNAFSILKTGKDEYGKSFPVIFKSFGDYKPGLYVYLDVPLVATLGLTEVSVRLPSAIFGIISVLLIYLILWNTFKNKTLSLSAAFIAATNPWLIYFARGAWEANVALTFTLFGIYFFLKSLKNQKYILLSAIFLGLTGLTYQGAKLSTSIVSLILLIIYWKDTKGFSIKYIVSSIVLGILISLPIVFSFFIGQAGRLDVFSIFSYPRPKEYTQAFLDQGGEKFGTLSYYLFHSELLNFKRGILGRYFNEFSGKFLFFEGDYQNPGHSAPYQGVLLLSDIFLVVIGVVQMIKNKTTKESLFFWLWLILAPLPAVLTRDQVQSVRALNTAVPLIIILAFGLERTITFIQQSKLKSFLYILLFVVYFCSFTYFLDAYFVHVPKHNSSYWNYGYKQVVEKISILKNEGSNIIVEQSFAQPYIYFLFYEKYDPVKYQKQAKLESGQNNSDVGFVSSLDSLRFETIDWSLIRNLHGSIVVIDGVTVIPGDLNYSEIDKIYFLNGRDLAFNIIKIK